MDQKGKLIVVSAPSGAGKTSIVHHLLNMNLGLEFSVSACSRPKRKNEINGKDYYFLSSKEFKNKIKSNEFFEWEEVYPVHYYGTLKSEVERIWKKGNHVIFDVDVKGALNIKKKYPERTLAVFIMPPSVEELENRLLLRSTESRMEIIKRISKAKKELSYSDQFDVVIVNEILEKAEKSAADKIRKFLSG